LGGWGDNEAQVVVRLFSQNNTCICRSRFRSTACFPTTPASSIDTAEV